MTNDAAMAAQAAIDRFFGGRLPAAGISATCEAVVPKGTTLLTFGHGQARNPAIGFLLLISIGFSGAQR